MRFATTKALLWLISPIMFEQWNDHCISHDRKTKLKLALSHYANHNQHPLQGAVG